MLRTQLISHETNRNDMRWDTLDSVTGYYLYLYLYIISISISISISLSLSLYIYIYIYIDWIQSLQKRCFLYIGLYRFIFEKMNIHIFLNIHFLAGLKK